jgi:lambda family phage portal protein
MRRSLARWLAPPPVRRTHTRMYAAARGSRLTAGFGSGTSSADSELQTSLTALRNRSRALVRDASFAKRARVIIQNNVVGTGIGLQAQVMTTRGELATRINEGIEREWAEWCRATACHTGAALHFNDLERMAMGQVFEAGEIFIRKHYRAFGDSRVPLALEIIEPERLADEFAAPQAINPNLDVRMGIEVDGFGAAQAYWIREIHPGDLRSPRGVRDRYVRVPADQMIHLRIVDRWPQTRGEPWLHAVARKLNDMDGYSEAEIIAARSAASYMGMIETPDMDSPIGETQADGTQQLELSPGLIERLGPGEKFSAFMPNRPNTAIDPFMRYMLREVAAGLSISYESLSRDYSQSNYSSSRLSLIDDRDVWRQLQQWFIRAFREPLHREWMQAAVLSRAVPEIPVESYALSPEKFRAVSFKPRGWSWVDPTKEVEAYKEAVKAGFTSTSRVIAATADGADVEDIVREIKRDKEIFAAADINVDTDVPDAPPEAVSSPAPAAPAQDAEDTPDAQDDPSARVVNLRKP